LPRCRKNHKEPKEQKEQKEQKRQKGQKGQKRESPGAKAAAKVPPEQTPGAAAGIAAVDRKGSMPILLTASIRRHRDPK
jgi:hypothetical protein